MNIFGASVSFFDFGCETKSGWRQPTIVFDHLARSVDIRGDVYPYSEIRVRLRQARGVSLHQKGHGATGGVLPMAAVSGALSVVALTSLAAGLNRRVLGRYVDISVQSRVWRMLYVGHAAEKLVRNLEKAGVGVGPGDGFAPRIDVPQKQGRFIAEAN